MNERRILSDHEMVARQKVFCALHDAGWSLRAIARRFGVHKRTVDRALSNRKKREAATDKTWP